jgi:hypothetical protein
MTVFPSYSIGTVSVGAGDTVIAGGNGAIWSATNARAGDDIVALGHTVIIQDVLDTGHLAIDPWPYDAVPAGTPYKIVQRSPLRYGLGQVAADVSRLVATLNTSGLPVIVPATATAPDPSLGEENQFALQPSAFKLWLKTAGAWVFQGIYKGFNVRGPWDAVTNFGVNDVVAQGGSSYAAIAPNTNQAPPNAGFWMVLAAKGDPGPQGLPGTPGTNGTNGAGYGGSSATSLTIGTGSKTFTGVATALAYQVSNYVRASSAANGVNFMEGFVTAYGDGSLTINVTKTGGAGTFADWNFALAGAPGTGDVSSTNNLSELANKDTALSNLRGVSYGVAQSLSAAQQQQARTNIGIGASTAARCAVITASATVTIQRSGRYLIKALGGGGGGGGYGGPGSVSAGGGAGGDVWTEANLTAGNTLTIQIGAGGPGGSATTGAPGSQGGATTVSGAGITTMNAGGGLGGQGRTNPGGVNGGAGGSASGGNLYNAVGCNGDHGMSLGGGNAFPGKGAGSRFGSGGRPGCELVSASGESGIAFGTGGGGGTEQGGAGGGAGAPGVVELILIEAF